MKCQMNVPNSVMLMNRELKVLVVVSITMNSGATPCDNWNQEDAEYKILLKYF